MSSLKLKHSGGNSMSIEAPATNPASNLALKLPATIGSANQILKNSGTAGTLGWSALVEDSSGNVGIGTTSPTAKFDVRRDDADGKITEFHQSGGYGIDIGSSQSVGYIASGYGQDFVFKTDPSSGQTERMRINSAGDVFIGTTTTNPGIGNYQTPGTMIRAGDGDYIAVSRAQNCPLFLNRDDSTGTLISLRYNATERGTIQTDGTNVVYNTSSDYRLKENVVNLTGAIDRLKTLLPKRFNFKELPSKTVDGFLAHEVTAVPEAITGTKDEVATTDDATRGIKKGDPIYQGIDQSKLVPLLTAALKEAITKIETLETKVAALEAG